MSKRILLCTAVTLMLLVGHIRADIGSHKDYFAYHNGIYGDAPAQTYFSDPWIWSPVFNVPIWNRSAISTESTPHLLISLGYQTGAGPFIFDSRDLSLVYACPGFEHVNNVRVQKYRGEKVLTFWAGKQKSGHARGRCYALDKHYNLVFSVSSSENLSTDADLHECEITEDDTVLITVYEPKNNFNFSSIGIPTHQRLLDSCFEEIDPITGSALFSWRASRHFSPSDGYHAYEEVTGDGFDPWHINSIQKTREGNYIVNLRRAHTIVLISGRDGKPIWQLGGKNNDFQDLSDGAAISFAWQHHTRFRDDDLTQLTLFDNRQLAWNYAIGCDPKIGQECSRGMRLEVAHKPRKTVKLVQELFAPLGIGSRAMGSYDLLPNGNSLLGWGSQAGFSEYAPDGNCVMDVAFGRYNSFAQSYRVFKDSWVGLPPWNPSIAIDDVRGNVLASWNGATEVRSWVIMAANERQTLTAFDSINFADRTQMFHTAKKGFETAIPLDDALDRFTFVRAAALDEGGHVLGASDIVHVPTGKSIMVAQDIDNFFYNMKYDSLLSQSFDRPR